MPARGKRRAIFQRVAAAEAAQVAAELDAVIEK
jgi:hypothetical protein